MSTYSLYSVEGNIGRMGSWVARATLGIERRTCRVAALPIPIVVATVTLESKKHDEKRHQYNDK